MAKEEKNRPLIRFSADVRRKGEGRGPVKDIISREDHPVEMKEGSISPGKKSAMKWVKNNKGPWAIRTLKRRINATKGTPHLSNEMKGGNIGSPRLKKK